MRTASISASVTRATISLTSRVLFVDDLAVDHADDAVGRAADADVVGDDQERQAALAVQPAHQLDDLLGVLAVEVAGRLVGPDDRRVVDERAGDRHALALAAGELVGQVRGALARARPARAPPSALRRASLAGTRATSSGSSTFSTARQDRHQVVELEDEAHPAGAVVGALARRHRAELDALDQHLAAVDPVEPGEAVEQRRLAGAARAHDRDHLAARTAKLTPRSACTCTLPVS